MKKKALCMAMVVTILLTQTVSYYRSFCYEQYCVFVLKQLMLAIAAFHNISNIFRADIDRREIQGNNSHHNKTQAYQDRPPANILIVSYRIANMNSPYLHLQISEDRYRYIEMLQINPYNYKVYYNS